MRDICEYFISRTLPYIGYIGTNQSLNFYHYTLLGMHGIIAVTISLGKIQAYSVRIHAMDSSIGIIYYIACVL